MKITESTKKEIIKKYLKEIEGRNRARRNSGFTNNLAKEYSISLDYLGEIIRDSQKERVIYNTGVVDTLNLLNIKGNKRDTILKQLKK